ncbi:hypothetical protein BVI434_1000004 [Burkholderia vietnamiensis]|nr:hypothetical protein BVI434_1000004 [Burkholderia vietnamiensis]
MKKASRTEWIRKALSKVCTLYAAVVLQRRRYCPVADFNQILVGVRGFEPPASTSRT